MPTAELVRVLRNLRVVCLQHELVVFVEFSNAKNYRELTEMRLLAG